MRGFLFYTGVIGFASGIFLRSFFSFGLPVILWVGLIGGVMLVVWVRARERSERAFLLLPLSTFLILFTLGMVRLELASFGAVNPQFESALDTEVTLEGVVVREPDVRESTTHLYTKVDGELLLVVVDRYGAYSYGDRIAINGVLARPEAFETDLGRTFNYPAYLQAQGVNYTMHFADVSVVASGEGNFIIATLLSFKHAFMGTIESVIPEPHVGLSEGLLLGVKRALGSEIEEVFRKTGIIHIVVLSGYNVMLVVLFVTYVLSFVIPFRARLYFGVGAITAFALIVGLSATVVRASLMAVLILVARATGRSYEVLRALMLAGVAMLLLNPYLLAFDTGFQLSFVATLGLILVAPHLEKRLTLMPKTIGLREFLTATLATQLFVLPILLYQIGEFSIVSVVVNVLVLPMVPVAMLLTFITGMIGFVSTTVAVPFAFLTYVSLAYILGVAERFASLPFASLVVPAFPFWVVPLAYACLGYALWWLWKRQGNARVVEQTGIDTFDDWVIEEESVVRARVGAEARSASAPTDTPIFFK